jgi:hypothetical protein
LRLDPDMLGLPASAGAAIELEYWGGPRFSEDIEVIPSGVTVHKHTDDERRLSRIDQTQIWWKSPETRIGEAGVKQFRTFEVEELIEDASAGLDGDNFGCRYAHAEYDLQSQAKPRILTVRSVPMRVKPISSVSKSVSIGRESRPTIRSFSGSMDPCRSRTGKRF